MVTCKLHSHRDTFRHALIECNLQLLQMCLIWQHAYLAVLHISQSHELNLDLPLTASPITSHPRQIKAFKYVIGLSAKY